jgi:hypothetical protein
MSRLWLSIILAGLLSACAQVGPTPPPPPPQASKPEAAPGRSVIYLVRAHQDLGNVPATLWLDDQIMGATYMGTHFRWEVAPGRRQIAGYGPDNGTITLDVQPDRTYYVQQVVRGGARANSPYSTFQLLNEAQGRAFVATTAPLGQL